MHHCFNVVMLEELTDSRSVGQIPPDELRLRMNGNPVPAGQIVKNDDFLPPPDQFLGDDTADVAGPAGDQDAHLLASSLVYRSDRWVGQEIGGLATPSAGL
jgi:hypothetical protein